MIFRMPRFRWNDWSIDHIAAHGVEPAEAQSVVEQCQSRKIGEGKYRAVGRGRGGRWLHVIYLIDPPGWIFVIHARPIEPAEIRRYRRSNK